MNKRRWSWRRAGIALVAVGVLAAIATRVLLPSVVRRLLLDRAQALHARIDVGAVELSLWWGGLVLRDVTVRSAIPPRQGADTPLIACSRVVLGWLWTPLFNRTVHLRRVEIEAPRVVLDRLADGDFNLAGLLPAPAKGKAKPSAPPKPEWTIAIDRLIVTDAGIRFRDLAVNDSGAVDASLSHVEAARIAFTPGQFGKSTRLRLDLAVDEGRVDVVARLVLLESGVSIAGRIRAQRLPLARTRLYAPELGWSDLAGRLSAGLRYNYVPHRLHVLLGNVRLDDVTVRVPQLDVPAFTAKQVTAMLAPIDFRRQRVTLDRVHFTAARLLVDPHAAAPVPLVAAKPGTSKPTTPSPWSVLLKSLTTDGAQVMLPTTPTPTFVDLDLKTHDAVVTGSARVPLRLSLAVGDASATFDGQTRVDAFDVAGELTLRDVSLPAVVDTFGWLPPHVLQTGKANGTFRLAAGGRSGDIELNGTATVDDVWIAAADPHEFSVGAKRAVGTAQPLRIATPLVLRLREVRMAAPYAEITRTKTGWLGPLPPSETDSTNEGTSPGVQIAIDQARLTGARAYLADRTVTPYFVGGLAPFDAELQHGEWPARKVEYLQIDGRPPERGQLSTRGWLLPGGSQFDIEATDVALPPLNPYVVAFTNYSVPRGRLSGTGTAWFGAWGWNAISHLTLHDFDLAGGAGDALFRERFGMSLAVGLAAMRDLHGDIALDVPLAVDADGARVGVSTVMSGAFEQALVNLLSTPGKLVKALLPSNADPQAALPEPIPFVAGQDVPTAADDDPMQRLAAFLAARPGVAVTLLGDVTQEDVRRMAEATVLTRLDASERMDPPADRATAQRLASALRRRRSGAEPPLSAADETLLDDWINATEVLAGDRQALASARLERVRTTLRQRFGLDARRVGIRPPTAAVDAGRPAVLLQFGPVGAVRQE